MNWPRDLLFLLVILGGVAVVGALLVPDVIPSNDARTVGRARDRTSLAPVVAAVNAALRVPSNESQVVPAAESSDLAVARRISLSLAGTIPSLEEIRWLESQGEDQRLDLWVDRLLNDRRSADYLAERLARTYVGVEQGPFLIYRRRRFVSWLADEILANRRYDTIVRELITSEGIWTDRPATNFVTVTVLPDEDQGPDEVRLAGRVTRAFLGIRLDCAECHDHPFEDWEQSDFQSLAAFFGGTEQTLRGVRDGDGVFTVDDLESDEPQVIEVGVPFSEELLQENGSRRARLARWVTHPENQAFSRATANRIWALLFGRPLVEPIDDIRYDERPPEVLAILADDFAQNRFNLQRLIRVITSTEAFRRESRSNTINPTAGEDSNDGTVNDDLVDFATAQDDWARFPLTRLRPEQVVGAVIQAASLETIDHESHIIVRMARAIGENEFVERYGDAGEEELSAQLGTIPQRLLLMNGKLVRERTEANPFNASGRIAGLAPTDEKAVETTYLAVLTRRPTETERRHFVEQLEGTTGKPRRAVLEDMYWTLINSTEFSWNH